MSYCRFSTNDFRSHVYCYKHTGGKYVIVVASQKYDYDNIKLPQEIPNTNFKVQYRRTQQVMDILQNEPLEPIGLKHDGEFFHVDTLEEMEEVLRELDEIGYYIPEIAYKNINAEKTE